MKHLLAVLAWFILYVVSDVPIGIPDTVHRFHEQVIIQAANQKSAWLILEPHTRISLPPGQQYLVAELKLIRGK